jgi:hypothetical protein
VTPRFTSGCPDFEPEDGFDLLVIEFDEDVLFGGYIEYHQSGVTGIRIEMDAGLFDIGKY